MDSTHKCRPLLINVVLFTFLLVKSTNHCIVLRLATQSLTKVISIQHSCFFTLRKFPCCILRTMGWIPFLHGGHRNGEIPQLCNLTNIFLSCLFHCSTFPLFKAPSRRGDLQILGFCLLHWLCGSLPWDNVLKDPAVVQQVKARLMDDLPDSVQRLSVREASTDEVAAFLLHVKTLDYQDKPDYQHLKKLLAGSVGGQLDFLVPERPAVKTSNTREKVRTPRGVCF
uniref:Uncharacterized protein n=1 Tax=Oryzias sinensis TaxID=183150 RepID=A0A8C7WSW3_9TELE